MEKLALGLCAICEDVRGVGRADPEARARSK
ncbi:MAG: hypothetical protein JWO30_3456 [Fibrobacteres bacterium]|nr:hypothetical protein [Fibrobacterota bacterium]